jgi:hypothetical protein
MDYYYEDEMGGARSTYVREDKRILSRVLVTIDGVYIGEWIY